MRQATAHINLDAIAHNLDVVREKAPGRKVMAVIKANAYGHGASQVALRLDAEAYAVSRATEAVALRDAGVPGSICLLEGACDREELNLASTYELQVVVHSEYQLDLMRAAGARCPVWIKVDTGMGRLGFSPREFCRLENQFRHLDVIGLMTHLAQASDPADPFTAGQLQRLEDFGQTGGLPWSIANSAAILAHPASLADWVRPGIMLYGATPFDDLEPVSSLLPAMTLSAPVIAVHPVPAGGSVGYGCNWTAAVDTRVAVVAAGYADGYPREIRPGTPVLLKGVRRPIVGAVSMDMICVELEPGDPVTAGDCVTLWGEGLPVEEIARSANTIAYTLTTGVSERVTRQYRGEKKRG